MKKIFYKEIFLNLIITLGIGITLNILFFILECKI